MHSILAMLSAALKIVCGNVAGAANPFSGSLHAKGLRPLVFPRRAGTPFSGWSKAKSAMPQPDRL
jgi:hypothetical protein